MKAGDRVEVVATDGQEWLSLGLNHIPALRRGVVGTVEQSGLPSVYVRLDDPVVSLGGVTWPKLWLPVACLKQIPSSAMTRLASAFTKLGPTARELLVDVAERLVKGAREHGDFETPRDWSREAYEEDLDAIVYRTQRLRTMRGPS